MKVSIYRLLRWVVAVLLAGPIITGNAIYAQQIEDPVVCPGDSSVLDIAYGQHPTGCNINTPDDIDRFLLCPEVGDNVRFKVAAPSNFMDPKLVVRDAGGAVVAMEVCLDNCAFTLSYQIQTAGCHTLFIRDLSRFSSGSYDLSMWCISGPCDSDADGVIDGDVRVSIDAPTVLSYGTVSTDEINPAIDADRFIFLAERAGT